MQFGLSGCGGGLEAATPAELILFAQLADRLGFSGLWLNEEHFQRPVAGKGRLCLSPLILAAVLGARTERIRIGFSVLLLPLHHPVRLAEEIATLDVMCGGRVDVGISRGGNPMYSEAFGVDPAKGRERFEEDLALLLRCWSEDEVCLGQGKYTVLPRPVQQPHPPIYIGTYNEETTRWIAKAGHRLIQHGIQSLSNVRRLLHTFENAGGAIDKVPVGRFVYVGESDASAKQELAPVLAELTMRLRHARVPERPGTLTFEELDPARFFQEMVIAGGPETCAEQIAELQDLLGIQYLNCLASFFGYLPPEQLKRSLNLLATEVMPKFSQQSRGSYQGVD